MRITNRVCQAAGSDLTAPEDGAVYVVDGGDAFALIDTGAGNTVEKILGYLRESGLLAKRAAYIVATHAHIDHIGGLAALREFLGCQVVAHAADKPAIESGDPRRTGANLYRMSCTPCPVDLTMDQDVLVLPVGTATLHLIHTPGHTPGSICAWVKDGEETVLFAQDLHGPFHADWGSDRDLWRKSLQQLLRLDADILCEGHFGVYSGKASVRSYIQSYLYR
ncbi:MAG: MBL fold metallo-hydrolase [Bacillota bacterium]|nr:MBL fold metallo-hydrolase [Bacillota bacterium]MDW7684577.1 MBL fold metallo-hydrolase [Bacillota bacterium]